MTLQSLIQLNLEQQGCNVNKEGLISFSTLKNLEVSNTAKHKGSLKALK